MLKGYKTDIVYSRQGGDQYHALLKLTSTALAGSSNAQSEEAYTFDLVNLQLRKVLMGDSLLLTNRSPVGFINGLVNDSLDNQTNSET